MPVWKTTDIEQEPQIILTNWRIMELENGDRYFVGRNSSYFEGRVSTAIQEWDTEKRTGKTASGRVYKLEGDSGVDLDADYVWNLWKRATKNEKCKDISQDFV